MPSSEKKADAAKASGKSGSARTGSPFVGHSLELTYPSGITTHHVICLAHDGGLIEVGDGDGRRWVNLAHVAAITVVEPDPSDAPDAVKASDFPALESRYGRVDVKVGGGERPTAG